VVMDIARRTGTPPSRLLMPMAYGSLLGGLTTLVGTPPNLVAPVAIEASGEMGLDPKLLVMAVALAASASFTSPISHPANVLVMGPGGYRFVDYLRVGVVLALVVMVTVLPLVFIRYG